VAELVDALASGASGFTAVKVRVLSWAPRFACHYRGAAMRWPKAKRARRSPKGEDGLPRATPDLIVKQPEHDPEKACPALVAGWIPVFRKDHAQKSYSVSR
jgi:hypothetical protein